LNPQPIDTLSLEHGGAEPGKEQCFVVRTVETIAATPIESAPSAPVCVTPVDRFPPAAPKSLAVVATTGAMNLIWDANSEPDLAGYLVLRGETPGDTLQPLTPEPIREPRFRDTTATPGVRYVYAIVAVDRAANRSAPSARVEETAR
jgi:fibronectin type 3 domain-containing protein